jgi:hypothetical protein
MIVRTRQLERIPPVNGRSHTEQERRIQDANDPLTAPEMACGKLFHTDPDRIENVAPIC